MMLHMFSYRGGERKKVLWELLLRGEWHEMLHWL